MTGCIQGHCYTTGSCAAAAVKGAALMLRDQMLVDEIDLTLPCGETAHFQLKGGVLGGNSASCRVVQQAGCGQDGAGATEIHATAQVEYFTKRRTQLKCGPGIGKVARPGMAAGAGEWAINPLSRRMIMEVVKEVFALRCIPWTLTLTISIPGGAELARGGGGERSGIVGGLEVRHGE